MFKTIRVANVATYPAVGCTLADVPACNYIFGGNGVGKSTLGSLLASGCAPPFDGCALSWTTPSPLQVLAYNRAFVEANFRSSTVKGIFTLGKATIEVQDQLRATRGALEGAQADLIQHTRTLQGEDGKGGKVGELEAARIRLRDRSFEVMRENEGRFKDAFEGVRNNKERFVDRLLRDREGNRSLLLTEADLVSKAITLFGPAPVALPRLGMVDVEAVDRAGDSPVLAKRVLGRSDVDIAALINHLQNSDWVAQGRRFLDLSDPKCPFCQQVIPSSLKADLEAYFDRSFVEGIATIETVIQAYEQVVEATRRQVETALAQSGEMLDRPYVTKQLELFDSLVAINRTRLVQKRAEPSAPVTLERVGDVLGEIALAIDVVNTRVDEHNRLLADRENQKIILVGEVWRYMLDVGCKGFFEEFDRHAPGLEKAIQSLRAQVDNDKSSIATLQADIRTLEREVTSTRPSIPAINQTLTDFNFTGFKLGESGGSEYRLLRTNGDDATDTLSEGERTFITFLYFYHLMKGSNTESGVGDQRVVVIDDPVSSLDSDVLFVVSTLVRTLADEVRSQSGIVRQLFVLTHNVYFHKEVTFKVDASNKVAFWMVRKRNERSVVERQPDNPVKSSYELLWHDVRHPVNVESSIQNTLRRILESYFRILGGLNLDKLQSKFSGRELQVCLSLVSWTHDGSHGVPDDVYMTVNAVAVETYLYVFKLIFERAGQGQHYRMMMGITEEQAGGDAPTVQIAEPV
ncbi:AAA family ATPase [Pinirhizobacter soli]|uniref:AAA family ATPase n=1 Tax=Pinirhizobacter soli TaxID=2786953 RepID=UPI00202A63BB|nr:AAA family ATPase [Pinirhizobacter soli]